MSVRYSITSVFTVKLKKKIDVKMFYRDSGVTR